MKKIVFGITSLTLGGAERVLVDIVNKLKDTYDITIFTIYAGGELEKQLSDKIKIQHICNCPYNELSYEQKKLMAIKILIFKQRIYKDYINRKYDFEIAFLEGPITRIFASYGSKKKKIAWIHNDISKVFGEGFKAKIKKIIDRLMYKKFNKLVFVSQDNKEKFENTYKFKASKKVIYNYIDKEKVIQNAEEKLDIEFDNKTTNILTIARLVEQKAIDRLIYIHSKMIKSGINNTIYVIGDGPEREKLEQIIKDEGVQDTFRLLGKKENPYPYIKHANLFCLLSHYEGYGMVLEEAKILDKYIIITDTAAREAVKDYKKSMIVGNNDEQIYNGLVDIIENIDKYVNETDEKIEYNNSNILEQIKEIVGD